MAGLFSYMKYILILIFLTIAGLLAGHGYVRVTTAQAMDTGSGGASADSVSEQPPKFIVRCDRVTVDDMQADDTLVVTLESRGKSIAGFDFKFGTDSRFITIADVLPGTVYDSCGWEYFHARQLDAKPDRPASLWQVVALSKMTPDTTRPACLLTEGKVALLKIVVRNAHPGEPVPDTAAPIFFYWEGCTDNVLSDASGSSMLISDKVFDYLGSDVTGSSKLFPTRTGAAHQCIKPGAVNAPKRAIEFHNGGIRFALNTDPLDSAGTSSRGK
jgi:hypothetical protein